MINKVEKKLMVAKESSEIVDAVAELIKDIKEGKEIAVIATENLPSLMSAIDGYDKLGDEFKSDARNETVAYAGYMIAEALAPDAPEKDESAE